MQLPFISICIPAYNRTNGLHRLLQSILEHTYLNYEIIITDDSTTTDVANLIQEWKNKLQINYHKNETALGTPQNWNKAISLANYDWIKIMHDDDWFAISESLQKFAEATIINTNFIFSANANIYFDENKKIEERLSKLNQDVLKKDILILVYKNIIGHPSNILVKKTNLQYDTQFKWVVDLDYYIQYLQEAKTFHYIDEILINTGIDNSTVSNQSYKNPKVEIPEYMLLLKKIGYNLVKTNFYVFCAIWTLVKKFKINDSLAFGENGFTEKIPKIVLQIINIQKRIPRILLKQTPINNILMKMYFKKLNNLCDVKKNN